MVTLSQFGNVPPDLLPNANYTLSIVNEIFAAFPGKFRFTSGYRSPEKNAAVNGVDNSFHIKALAGDFVPVNGRFEHKAEITQILSKYGYELVIHNVGSGFHYHIEPSPNWQGINSTGSNNSNNILLALGLLAFILLID